MGHKVGPFFKHFGSKWSAAKLYPEPEHPLIIEPFAGGAGYACNHAERNVILWDTDPNVAALWTWLLCDATPDAIREIPLGVPEGTDIRAVGLSAGQSLLLKHWQRTNNVGDCWTISPWGNKPGQWTANTRARLSEEVTAIQHWDFVEPDCQEIGTWFIDPPYFGNYAYRQPRIDFEALANRVLALRGQVIVCEGGDAPKWLPFEPLATRVTSRRKTSENHHCKEWIFTRGGS